MTPSDAIPIVTNFWDAADRAPLGHKEPLSRLRELILSTQEPATCSRRCTFLGTYHGGALADVRRLAYALMYAITNNCALVSDWPKYQRTLNSSATMTTSPELRQRCIETARKGINCYFLPVTTCSQTKGPARRTQDHGFSIGNAFHLDEYLDRVQRLTGLRSEALVMGTLVAWVMRPQPELREAILLYGSHAGFATPGIRHRRVGMHVRKGDKHSLYAKHMRDHSWRVSAESFNAWGRRVAADIGADRVLYMTDDTSVMNVLNASGGYDGLFSLVPAPRDCLPSYTAGIFGKPRVPAASSLSKLHQPRGVKMSTVYANGASAACGPRYLIDDGIQLFAGVALLAQCTAFVGTQISNVAGVVVELMSTLRHPPVAFDVLNDVHRACLSDERVWFGGTHAHRRDLRDDRLALADGNHSHGEC